MLEGNRARAPQLLNLRFRARELHTPQPACLQPGLFNERSHCSEEPVHSRVGPARQRKSERSKEDPAQPKIKF